MFEIKRMKIELTGELTYTLGTMKLEKGKKRA